MTRTSVVGHAEWVTFARVARLPAAGEIVHATATWDEPGGGGGIVAVHLESAFFTAAGDDGLVDALAGYGVAVHAAPRPASRRIVTHLDDAGERTITTLGDRVEPRGDDPLPWGSLAGADGVFVTAGDAQALRAARAAPVVVATPRAGPVLDAIEVDALVWSAADPVERELAARITRARLRVETHGAGGGTWTAADGTSGTWAATGLPGPPVDAFGCGDAFVAGLTAGLAAGERLDAALHRAAGAGAAALTGRGPYGALERIRAWTVPA
ncbi:MAG: ribokinase [Solirubrobacteraceae bacterium]|nr:ribokinase [Solirubrobacteraceae bacterium]